MTKFKIAADETGNMWQWAVGIANRKCYDSNKQAPTANSDVRRTNATPNPEENASEENN